MSGAVIVFVIVLCFRSSFKSANRVDPQMNGNVQRQPATGSSTPNKNISLKPGEFPRIERPGQYYDR